MVSLNAAVAAFALSAGGPTVMYDFYADWCGPCRAMNPTVAALKAKGLPIKKVNIDHQPDLAKKYGISRIPCFVMVVDGREVDRELGFTDAARLEQMCRRGMQAESSASVANAPKARSAVADRGGASGWNQADGRVGPSDEQLLAVTVRLRVSDPRGFGWGTGTIVDAREGEALVLTCGHIFRDSEGKGQIDIDLFGSHAGQRVAGNLIGYDLKRDVALVSFRAPGPIQPARLAPADHVVHPGDAVASVGCSNGDDPTVARSRVSTVNRFLGPPNLQVTGAPVEGRSGGGLFSEDGLVIGVCNGAQHDDGEGFYAALGSIHGHIAEVGLAHVFDAPAPSNTTPAAGEPSQLAATSPSSSGDPPTMPKSMPSAAPPAEFERLPQPGASIAAATQPASSGGFSRPSSGAPHTTPGSSPAATAPLSKTEQAALDEIRRRLDGGAEVVCVIRSRTDPTARSEIIMLDRASPAFLKELAAEAKQGPAEADSLARRRTDEGRRSLPSVAPTSAQQPTAVNQWAPTDGSWNSSPRVVRVRPPVESQARAD